MTELERLLDQPVEFNGYLIRPTEHAYQSARRVLELAACHGFPEPELTPDGEAGIDVEWEAGGRQVSVSCRARPELRDSVFHREGDEYDARPATDAYIIGRLRWLSEVVSAAEPPDPS